MNKIKCAECGNEIIYSDDDVFEMPSVENGIYVEIDVVICDFCGCEQSI